MNNLYSVDETLNHLIKMYFGDASLMKVKGGSLSDKLKSVSSPINSKKRMIDSLNEFDRENPSLNLRNELNFNTR